jgi:glycosyltransferase involved in cell wall biosynthesis
MIAHTPDRVTVAIPAYNAASTLDETLLSVRRQTHRDLEIFVVDDGSKDATAEVAQRHADADARVTVIHKKNGGVSTARNVALERATAPLLACVDADDVWHPEKIEAQIASLRNSGPNVLLSYTWFAYIDEASRILSTAEPSEEGNVVARMCRGNLVGNGSSPLMRTDMLREVGGWDVTAVDGNEDYKNYFALAERGEFTVVRSHLLGYRQSRENRSSSAPKMLASYDRVVAEFLPRHPEHSDQFEAGRRDMICYLFDKAVLNQRWDGAAYLLREGLRPDGTLFRRLLLNTPLIASRMVLPLRVRALWQKAGTGGRLKAKVFPAHGAESGIRMSSMT